MRFIIILAITLQLAPLCAAHAQSGSPPVITGQVGDSGKSGLRWKSVDCAAGSAINAIAINEGGWTAGIEFFCSQPTATNDWPLVTPTISAFVGGENGDHQAQLMCPRDSWVVGLTGTEIDVHYLANTQFRHFLANPIAVCNRPANNATTTTAVPDPRYKPVKMHEDSMSGPYNLGTSTIMCPRDMYATGMDIAVEPEHHPDIKAVKLHCKTRADL